MYELSICHSSATSIFGQVGMKNHILTSIVTLHVQRNSHPIDDARGAFGLRTISAALPAPAASVSDVCRHRNRPPTPLRVCVHREAVVMAPIATANTAPRNVARWVFTVTLVIVSLPKEPASLPKS